MSGTMHDTTDPRTEESGSGPSGVGLVETPEPHESGAPTPEDLADLIGSFNEVTAKLESTHDQLRGEVVRLRGELDEARERLDRSKRMAALGEMAAGIAHEIRNPLGSIGLYARMLTEDLPEGSEPRATAEKIAGAVRRLNAVVGDVLAFSRGMNPAREPIPCRELFASAGNSSAAADGVEVSIGSVCAAVPCDQTLVHQALVNLIQNARQAIAEAGVEGGQIELDAAQGMELDEHGRRRPIVRLRVRDNGPGIDPGVSERMFNPFFTTRDAGTGLGLAIVHRIMDAHGGRVVIGNNEDGPGATAELRFPAEQETTRKEAA